MIIYYSFKKLKITDTEQDTSNVNTTTYFDNTPIIIKTLLTSNGEPVP